MKFSYICDVPCLNSATDGQAAGRCASKKAYTDNITLYTDNIILFIDKIISFTE